MIYSYLCLVSVVLHVSVPYPSPKNPHGYGLDACSGVFVSPNEILTAEHCIEESRGYQWIRTNENKVYSVSIERKDKEKDLALLLVNKPINHNFAVLGSPVNVADYVYTVNNGDDFPKTYNYGIVNNIIYDEGVLELIHSATIMPGASGSGLFSFDGKLIGLNVARIYGLNEAVDYYEIEAFLNRR